MLSADGVSAGKVNSIAEALQLAEELGLEPVVEISDEGHTRMSRQVANPIRLSVTPARCHRPSPMPGEHDGDTFEVSSTNHITGVPAFCSGPS
ncbi:MAG: CoA transferase [Cryobacterium sp.]|nr:CoA transferase [Cryobacterium sp.]